MITATMYDFFTWARIPILKNLTLIIGSHIVFNKLRLKNSDN